MERPDLWILDYQDSDAEPERRRQVPLWAIMVVVAAVAVTLALVRGWELGCGLIAVWVAVLLALTETLRWATKRSRVEAASIVAIGYPWLAFLMVAILTAARNASQPEPVLAEAITILVRVILVGAPLSLIANYYLVLAVVYPLGAGGRAVAPPDADLHALVRASVASWGLSFVLLVIGLVLTA